MDTFHKHREGDGPTEGHSHEGGEHLHVHYVERTVVWSPPEFLHPTE